MSAKKNQNFLNLSKYLLLEVHLSSSRSLCGAIANPVSLPSRYRVGIVRDTNIDQIETTPLRYADTVEHAYLRL